MVVSFYLLTGNQINEDKILADNKIDSSVCKKDAPAHVMKRKTEEEIRLSYEYERKWLTLVENGTVVQSNMFSNEESL